MDRLCSTIFLLLVVGSLISNAFQEEQLYVNLEPKYINVSEGDSVTINCTFQPGGKYMVRWYYSQTNLGCDSAAKVKTNVKRTIFMKHYDTGSTFNINSITTNDSGWYFCKVIRDIPVLEAKCSNGVQVEVQVIGSLISNALQEEQLNVHAEPKYINVSEGDSVTINCTFQPGGKYKVAWYYSQTNLGCDSAGTDKINVKGNMITKHNDTGSTFIINSITTNDSGWYFCKVIKDIPVLDEKCSNGTQIEVTSICRFTVCV